MLSVRDVHCGHNTQPAQLERFSQSLDSCEIIEKHILVSATPYLVRMC